MNQKKNLSVHDLRFREKKIIQKIRNPDIRRISAGYPEFCGYPAGGFLIFRPRMIRDLKFRPKQLKNIKTVILRSWFQCFGVSVGWCVGLS